MKSKYSKTKGNMFVEMTDEEYDYFNKVMLKNPNGLVHPNEYTRSAKQYDDSCYDASEVNYGQHSIEVLHECIEMQHSKGRDYHNPNSSVKQADHYRRGIDSIHDLLNTKMLRATSLLEAHGTGAVSENNHESLEDTYKDIVNYASFAVSYLRYRMDGQKQDRDIFNKERNDLYLKDVYPKPEKD